MDGRETKYMNRFMKIEANSVMARRGFSLIEMMVVLGVVGLLLAMSAPNLFSLLTSTSLSGEGSVLRNQLTYAQQIAVSKSSDVEVRFFKYAEAASAQPDERFRAYQLYQYNREGDMEAISEFFKIKAPVAVNEELTTILDPSMGAQSGKEQIYGSTAPTAGKATVALGGEGGQQSVDYVAFRFRPDGSTDLKHRAGSNDTWYITLVQGETNVEESDPPNYLCLQVNPYNGQVSEFRP